MRVDELRCSVSEAGMLRESFICPIGFYWKTIYFKHVRNSEVPLKRLEVQADAKLIV